MKTEKIAPPIHGILVSAIFFAGSVITKNAEGKDAFIEYAAEPSENGIAAPTYGGAISLAVGSRVQLVSIVTLNEDTPDELKLARLIMHPGFLLTVPLKVFKQISPFEFISGKPS